MSHFGMVCKRDGDESNGIGLLTINYAKSGEGSLHTALDILNGICLVAL